MNRYVLVAFASCVSVAPYALHAEGLTRQQITFISRLVATESRDNQYDRNGAVLVSSAGALGRMQLMPKTAAALHVNPYRPDDNVRGGLILIMHLLEKYQGNQRNMAAAYNCGESCADAWIAGRRELPSETIHYIESVANTTELGAVDQPTPTTPAPQAELPPDNDPSDPRPPIHDLVAFAEWKTRHPLNSQPNQEKQP